MLSTLALRMKDRRWKRANVTMTSRNNQSGTSLDLKGIKLLRHTIKLEATLFAQSDSSNFLCSGAATLDNTRRFNGLACGRSVKNK